MTMTKDNIIDRDELQDAMINQILDDMDIKTMMAILYDHMSESYDKYTVDELIEEEKELLVLLKSEKSPFKVAQIHLITAIPMLVSYFYVNLQNSWGIVYDAC